MSDSILTVNGGSSSIKLARYARGESPRRTLSGKIDRIGLGNDVTFDVTIADEPQESFVFPARDHRGAITGAIDWLAKRNQLDDIRAIGHRVVHGGPRYSGPQRVTAELLDELRHISSLAPEHMPPAISLFEVLLERFPNLPQVACFDTAFHRDMPAVAKLLSIPRRFQIDGVQRYGFHGLSYQYLIAELERLAGPNVAHGRVILAHFGNGASLAAVKGCKGIDTSMGFTPAAGIPMGRRSGDLDPGLVAYLSRTANISPEQFHHITNRESGLLGVSGGLSPDMRDLLNSETTNPFAADAVNLFCYQAKKWIGAYAAALGGLDALVFSGGIGENAAPVRARICAGLEFLGIQLDEPRNAANAPIISNDASRVAVRVIPTDEEIVIARAVIGMI